MTTVEISMELSSYIEALQYDREALKELLCLAAERGLGGSQDVKLWLEDYKSKNKEYQAAKALLEREFVRPRIGGGAADWSLDFATATVSIREKHDEPEQ